MMRMFATAPWGQIKSSITAGAECFYADEGDFWNIWVKDPALTCLMPKVAAFQSLGPDITGYFDEAASVDFEQNFKDKMNLAKGE